VAHREFMDLGVPRNFWRWQACRSSIRS
jgi:hypothetical protein